MELVNVAKLKPCEDVIDMFKKMIQDVEEGRFGNNPRIAISVENQETGEGMIFGFGLNCEREDCVYLFSKGIKYLLG